MNGSRRRFGWGLAVTVLLLSAVVGVVAYNIGVTHGLAQIPVATGAAAQGAPGAVAPGVVPMVPYPYYWYRPWGFGFGFPILFFVFLWFVLLRGLWWRGGWRHRYYYAGGVPAAFDEWHRRAHEQMKEGPSADNPDRRG